jgi:hypothetical protein
MTTCEGTAANYLLKYSIRASKQGHKNFNGGNRAEFEQKESVV